MHALNDTGLLLSFATTTTDQLQSSVGSTHVACRNEWGPQAEAHKTSTAAGRTAKRNFRTGSFCSDTDTRTRFSLTRARSRQPLRGRLRLDCRCARAKT